MPRPDTPLHKLLDQAVMQFHAGELDQAQRLCEHVLKQDPRSARASHVAGIIAKQKLEFDTAIARLTLAHRIEPSNPFIIRDLGEVYVRTGQAREAIPLLSNTIDRASEVLELFSVLGEALEQIGQFEPAIRAHSHVAEKLPQLATAHLNLGRAYRLAKQLEKARASLEAAVERDAALAPAWRLLAEIAQMEQRHADACSAMAHYVALMPHDASGWKQNMALCFKGHHYPAALRSLLNWARARLLPKIYFKSWGKDRAY